MRFAKIKVCASKEFMTECRTLGIMKNWKEENDSLKATFKFKNFIEAWAFMSKVAMVAEKMNHHPIWSNVYNQVEISLSTHDAGNTVTDLDRELAEKIDKLI